MGAHTTQKLIEFRSTKIDEGLPILRAFCGSAIISNDLRSHRKILRRTLHAVNSQPMALCIARQIQLQRNPHQRPSWRPFDVNRRSTMRGIFRPQVDEHEDGGSAWGLRC